MWLLFAILGGLGVWAYKSKPVPTEIKLSREAPVTGLGDIDGDGIITQHDIDMVKDYISGVIILTDEQWVNADTDLNQVVDQRDVVNLERYIHGLDALPPVIFVH
jgi:hypothetical protein